jgi:hypothetical protein
MANTKICSKCGRELPLSEFYKDKQNYDGFKSYCKDCFKQYYVDNREHVLERQKQYNAEHAEAIKHYKKQWDADNPQYMKQYLKEYRATIEGYARVVRNNNLQEDRKYGRIAADEDPLPSIEQYIELLQQRDYYDGKQYHWSEMGLDRIDNSKAHTIDNVVPCTTEHNRQRGRKSFEEFRALMQNSI